MKNFISILFLLLIIIFVSCSDSKDLKNISKVSITNTFLEKVEPTNWWVGFKDTSLQLLVKEENIGNSKPSISYAGVSIKKVNKARSENYLFIDLEIKKSTKPGEFDIIFTFDDNTKKNTCIRIKTERKKSQRLHWF